MKKIAIYIIIFALSALAITGAIIAIIVQNAHKDFEKNLTITEGTLTDTLEMVAYGLNPGTKKEYTVNLKCAEAMGGAYTVILDYQQKEDSPLKEFVDVEILVDDESVFTGKLSDMLDESADSISFDTTIFPKDPVKIVFRYSVAKSVGNEAMGKTATFNIVFTAKK